MSFIAQRLHKRLGDVHAPLEADLIARALSLAHCLQLPLHVTQGLQLVAQQLQQQQQPLPPLLLLSASELADIIAGARPPPPSDAALEAARVIYPVYVANQVCVCVCVCVCV